MQVSEWVAQSARAQVCGWPLTMGEREGSFPDCGSMLSACVAGVRDGESHRHVGRGPGTTVPTKAQVLCSTWPGGAVEPGMGWVLTSEHPHENGWICA